VVFDRVQSNSASSPKTFLLHFPNSPTISGNTVVGVNGNQALKLTALTPAGQSAPTMKVVNEAVSSSGAADPQYRLEETTSGQAQSYLINVIQARGTTGADLTVTMTEDANGFTITLVDPTTGKTAVVKLNKGMSSAGGSFGYSATGTPTSFTPLTSQAQRVHATANGVTWGNGLQVSAPATATAGSSFSVTVSALTASGGVDAGYTGTVHLTSTDGQAVLPADYAFTAADAGTHTFTV